MTTDGMDEHDQLREAALHIQALTQRTRRLEDALRYIAQPTMGRPGAVDAATFAKTGAAEVEVRLALSTCIWIASEAMKGVTGTGEALEFYADPLSYSAIAIFPDRPAGAFADDIGCVLIDEAHDHRHGRTARRALGNEWWGAEPCTEMLKLDEREEEDPT